jgi:hypothetical protein
MENPANVEQHDEYLPPPPANVEHDEDPPPPPPTLIRQNAQVMGTGTVIIENAQYPIQDYQGIEFVTINGTPYNLLNDANGRYVVMNGTNTPAQGGRRRSRRNKRRKSKQSRRSRRV